MPDSTYIACPRCGELYAMSVMQKQLFHGRTLTCQQCAKPFTITEQTPDPAPAQKYSAPAPSAVKPFAEAPAIEETPPPSQPTVMTLEPRVRPNAPKLAMLIFAGVGVLFVFIYLVIMPSVHRSRENARISACSSNLVQIGMALQLYASSNGGVFPDSLEPLVLARDIPADMLICPATHDTPAPGKTPAEQVAALAKGAHQSYIYIGKGVKNGPVSQILAYEPLSNHGNLGVNILYTDGSVQALPPSAAVKALPQLLGKSATQPSTQPSP